MNHTHFVWHVMYIEKVHEEFARVASPSRRHLRAPYILKLPEAFEFVNDFRITTYERSYSSKNLRRRSSRYSSFRCLDSSILTLSDPPIPLYDPSVFSRPEGLTFLLP
jgi:hypothetical protein